MCSNRTSELAERRKKKETSCAPQQSGPGGKTVPDLEKTIGLMKKVVERLQRENQSLKTTSVSANKDRAAALKQEHEKLKVVHLRHLTCCRCWLFQLLLTHVLFPGWLREITESVWGRAEFKTRIKNQRNGENSDGKWTSSQKDQKSKDGNGTR